MQKRSITQSESVFSALRRGSSFWVPAAVPAHNLQPHKPWPSDQACARIGLFIWRNSCATPEYPDPLPVPKQLTPDKDYMPITFEPHVFDWRETEPAEPGQQSWRKICGHLLTVGDVQATRAPMSVQLVEPPAGHYPSDLTERGFLPWHLQRIIPTTITGRPT